MQPLMSEQVRIGIKHQIHGANQPSFRYVGLNNTGQRTFFGHVPILLLPHLFEHSPMSRLWLVHGYGYDVDQYEYEVEVEVETNISTRMSVLFCHLRNNMADMLEVRIKRYSRRRRRLRG
jgi:hypothetical protein